MTVERRDEPGRHTRVDRRTVLRGTALAAGGVLLGGIAGIPAADRASAATRPKVYTRADWGARAPKNKIEVVHRGATHIVVHHTATANASDTSTSHAASLSRSIQRYHMDTNGWSDMGQQFTISRGGHIMEGRDQSLRAVSAGHHVLGAHTANHNEHAIGIENEGTYTSATPPAALLDSLADTCAWLCLAYRLDPDEAIVGHRDFNATGCPGDKLYAALPQLRSTVRSRMRQQLAHPGAAAVAAPEPDQLPTYPDVPRDEQVRPYSHGPAVGERDTFT
ncbi:peptidoglycan recognition protein family protein [Nocardiopsis dassonvillei]|uniref:peptidoglycan recognition protein family protein n=1 Tax=Nocardiopsis dassonvillei TaxID=2014 RepID=UPI0020101B58|nr:peptidoglycan recognition family protein [Nocardiopsis dassonvillei]MCK9871831.1 peptidoglycan recognition protein family protein [Nocardiopsis dassonvillei]